MQSSHSPCSLSLVVSLTTLILLFALCLCGYFRWMLLHSTYSDHSELLINCSESFCGHCCSCMFTFIHPPTFLGLLTQEVGFCQNVCTFMCVFLFWMVCVHVLCAYTSVGIYWYVLCCCLNMILPSSFHITKNVLITHQGQNVRLYMYELCMLFANISFLSFLIYYLWAGQQHILCIQISIQTTYWQMTCVT